MSKNCTKYQFEDYYRIYKPTIRNRTQKYGYYISKEESDTTIDVGFYYAYLTRDQKEFSFIEHVSECVKKAIRIEEKRESSRYKIDSKLSLDRKVITKSGVYYILDFFKSKEIDIISIIHLKMFLDGLNGLERMIGLLYSQGYIREEIWEITKIDYFKLDIVENSLRCKWLTYNDYEEDFC